MSHLLGSKYYGKNLFLTNISMKGLIVARQRLLKELAKKKKQKV